VECERDLSTQPPRATLAKTELANHQVRIGDPLATEVADELFADDYSQGVLPVSVSMAGGFYDPRVREGTLPGVSLRRRQLPSDAETACMYLDSYSKAPVVS
jgi:hypothetical protein